MHYDIIGDIHGHADKLEALLVRMGYREREHAWRHPDRTAIFVGDFIDRGPHQLRTLEIVQAMVEAGAALAVMGNHELNAIAWHTPHPERPGEFLRPHVHPTMGDKNHKQHARFLEEIQDDPARHKAIIDWFMTLPLWLDLPGIRIVHACWHQPYMDWLRPLLTDQHQLRPGLLHAATEAPASEDLRDYGLPTVFSAVEAIVKGLEIPLPAGCTFYDKDGTQRNRVRVRWWDATARNYPQAALLNDATLKTLPDEPIPETARIESTDDRPVFFGHYWMRGAPDVQTPSAACVDYSAGRGGDLMAYRWSGERALDRRNFVSVPE